jgi:hypothetical protein
MPRDLDDWRERMARVARERGARLVLDLQARTDLEAKHLREPVETLLLALAAHAGPAGEVVVRARDRAGGDVEIVVSGLKLPPGFPEGDPHEDLWRFAQAFLRDHHRARIVQDEDAVRVLLLHGERAARLRQGGLSPWRGATPSE